MWGTELIGDPVLGKVAGFILLLAFIPYILSILGWEIRFSNRAVQLRPTKTPTRPSRATWLVWFLMDVGVVVSLLSIPEARNTLWLALALVAGSATIVVLSFLKGTHGWTKLEKRCLFGAGCATLAWLLSGSPLLALFLYLVVDTFAYIPTIVKSYSEPETEEKFAWLMTFSAVIVNILAVESNAWETSDVAALLFPLYLIVMDGIIVALLFRPRFLKNISYR